MKINFTWLIGLAAFFIIYIIATTAIINHKDESISKLESELTDVKAQYSQMLARSEQITVQTDKHTSNVENANREHIDALEAIEEEKDNNEEFKNFCDTELPQNVCSILNNLCGAEDVEQ